jgi:hypothetical protein
LHKIDDLRKRISELDDQGQVASAAEAREIRIAVDQLPAAMT